MISTLSANTELRTSLASGGVQVGQQKAKMALPAVAVVLLTRGM